MIISLIWHLSQKKKIFFLFTEKILRLFSEILMKRTKHDYQKWEQSSLIFIGRNSLISREQLKNYFLSLSNANVKPDLSVCFVYHALILERHLQRISIIKTNLSFISFVIYYPFLKFWLRYVIYFKYLAPQCSCISNFL